MNRQTFLKSLFGISLLPHLPKKDKHDIILEEFSKATQIPKYRLLGQSINSAFFTKSLEQLKAITFDKKYKSIRKLKI
jgi:hypothetical protein